MGQIIELELVAAPTPEARALIDELDQELAVSYAPEQRHGLALGAIFQPRVRFFVARRGGAAVGCGGIALRDGIAEVKRMYVRREARGEGVAEALLARLEAEATDGGVVLLRLETGTHQGAAIRFYRRCGFHDCPPFDPYASMPPQAIAESLFFEKRIAMEEGLRGG